MSMLVRFVEYDPMCNVFRVTGDGVDSYVEIPGTVVTINNMAAAKKVGAAIGRRVGYSNNGDLVAVRFNILQEEKAAA